MDVLILLTIICILIGVISVLHIKHKTLKEILKIKENVIKTLEEELSVTKRNLNS